MLSYEVFHWPSRVLLNLLVFFALVLHLHLVATEHRVTVYRRGHLQSLTRPSCSSPNQCPDNSVCHQRKCVCMKEYIEVQKFVNHSYISNLKMTCLPIARLDDRCVSTDQCVTDYSVCQLISQMVAGVNQTNHYCKCSPGHDVRLQDTADLILNGNTYRLKPVCSWERSSSATWLSTLILISLLVIFILIGTFVALVRYQRWRNQRYPSTITSIAASPGMNSHVMGNNHMGVGRMEGVPPPMGSAEGKLFPEHLFYKLQLFFSLIYYSWISRIWKRFYSSISNASSRANAR